MPEELYRRCPACLDSALDAPCSACGGVRFAPAGTAAKGRHRWRLRISTLMLLVVIAGLASYIVADLWHRAEDARGMALQRARVIAEAQKALARAVQAQASAQTLAPSGPTR